MTVAFSTPQSLFADLECTVEEVNQSLPPHLTLQPGPVRDGEVAVVTRLVREIRRVRRAPGGQIILTSLDGNEPPETLPEACVRVEGRISYKPEAPQCDAPAAVPTSTPLRFSIIKPTTAHDRRDNTPAVLVKARSRRGGAA